MSDDIRDAVAEIQRAHAEADMPLSAVEYRMEFTYKGKSLAIFEATTPLPIPVEGQEIAIHGVPAAVRSVTLAYENTSPGAPPSVYATVNVQPLPQR